MKTWKYDFLKIIFLFQWLVWYKIQGNEHLWKGQSPQQMLYSYRLPVRDSPKFQKLEWDQLSYTLENILVPF